jgi:hypothetical protein
MGNIAIVGDLPGIDELEQVYRLDATEAEPEGMPSEDQPAEPPSEDVPAEPPSEDVPAEPPSEDVPAGPPSEDQPERTPGIRPEGMPSELSNRWSVAGGQVAAVTLARLASTRLGFLDMSRGTHKLRGHRETDEKQ